MYDIMVRCLQINNHYICVHQYKKYSTRFELDSFYNIAYSATRQLSHSLRTSYDKKYPIRVFRSSKSRKYAPSTDKKGATRYRYDGLYGVLDYCIVDDCFQGEGYFMFFLFRLDQLSSISDVINEEEEAKNEKDSSVCERKRTLDDTKDNGDNFEFETALTLCDLNKDSVSNLTNPVNHKCPKSVLVDFEVHIALSLLDSAQLDFQTTDVDVH
jgi:hypothetical protein